MITSFFFGVSVGLLIARFAVELSRDFSAKPPDAPRGKIERKEKQRK